MEYKDFKVAIIGETPLGETVLIESLDVLGVTRENVSCYGKDFIPSIPFSYNLIIFNVEEFKDGIDHLRVGVPIVGFTVVHSLIDRENDFGIDGVIVKPFQPVYLYRVLDKLANEGLIQVESNAKGVIEKNQKESIQTSIKPKRGLLIEKEETEEDKKESDKEIKYKEKENPSPSFFKKVIKKIKKT